MATQFSTSTLRGRSEREKMNRSSLLFSSVNSLSLVRACARARALSLSLARSLALALDLTPRASLWMESGSRLVELPLAPW